MEATGNWMYLYETIEKYVPAIVLAHPLKTRAIAEARIKTDIIDATTIDTYSKVAFAKLYDRKTPVTAADLLNDRVLAFFEEHELALLRVLTGSRNGVLRNGQPRV